MATKHIIKKRNLKKEQIFSAALEIFGQYGYKKATLGDIAQRLNMTKSSLYRYVENKQDLYTQAVSFGLIRWRQTSLDAIQKEDDPLMQLKNYAMTGLTYLDQDRDLRNVLLNDPALFPLNSKEDPFSPINRAAIDILKQILKRGVEKKRFRAMDIEITASFLYSVYVMFIIKAHVKSDLKDTDQVLAAGLETLLFGIVKP